MILKSLGHKTRSFGKLLAYVARGAEGVQESPCRSFSRNLMGDGADLEAVTRAFEDNARFLRPRQGGNWCYHEIIALPKAVKEKTRAGGEAVLFALAEAYVAKRAPRQLVWGRVHWEAEHPHLHLVISANEVRSPRRVRVPKARFTKLVEELEAFKCARWPDLPEKLWQHRKRYNRQRRTHAEEQVTRRTGRASQRSQLAETLTALFAKARWLDDLDQSMAARGLKLYRRGQAWGVIDLASGKRHRLRSLGLLEAFRAMSDRILSQEQRLDLLMKARACDRERAGGRERTREHLAPIR
jgi:hypothetical protein